MKTSQLDSMCDYRNNNNNNNNHHRCGSCLRSQRYGAFEVIEYASLLPKRKRVFPCCRSYRTPVPETSTVAPHSGSETNYATVAPM